MKKETRPYMRKWQIASDLHHDVEWQPLAVGRTAHRNSRHDLTYHTTDRYVLEGVRLYERGQRANIGNGRQITPTAKAT